MLSHVGIAVATFVVTNVDDLLLLCLYFGNPRYKPANIVIGQYLGITTLILVSFLGILLGEILENHWISLLGIVPIILGITEMLSRDNGVDGVDLKRDSGRRLQFLNVALITIANGGDNIGVYAPLFANTDVNQIFIYPVVFAVLTAVWCLLGYYMVKHARVKSLFARYGQTVLPFFLILLGIFIMKDFFVWLIYK